MRKKTTHPPAPREPGEVGEHPHFESDNLPPTAWKPADVEGAIRTEFCPKPGGGVNSDTPRSASEYLEDLEDAELDRQHEAYAALVRDVQRGRRSERTLLRALMPKMLRYAQGRLGTEHPDVEDALQDALHRLTYAIEGIEHPRAVVKFAFGIVDNCARAYRRRQTRSLERFAGTDCDDLADRREAKEPVDTRLGRAIVALPVAHQVTLLLDGLGFSAPEIATLTGCPEGTVRQRICTARARLRETTSDDE
ncbi:MAG: RNA polymerase sigma factor [Sandaracinaceae bacterium]|nr:RNA polymerase sigma factor [Sandaracinaceae bacterium]